MSQQEAHEWLKQRQPEITAELIEWCNQNSGSYHLPGLLKMADRLEASLSLGVACQRIPLQPRQTVDNFGEVHTFESAPVLRWDLQPNAKRRLLLAIHYDTVFGVDHEFQHCQSLAEDKLQGPGVADAKGGLCVIKNAVLALQKFGDLRDLGISIVLNPDEEIGSVSSVTYFQQIAEEFDFGLLFEPALPSGQLVSERKGSGNFEIVVRGRSAHAGRHFHDGRNALAKLCDIFHALNAMNSEGSATTINVGAIHGGGPVNVVPDLAVGRFNVRVPDEAAIQNFHNALQTVLQDSQTEGFDIQLYGGILSPPKLVSAAASRLMTAIEESHHNVKCDMSGWRTTGGVCDGNKLAAAGLPNIDTLGPIGDGLHSRQEWVQPSSIVSKSMVVFDLVQRYAAEQYTIKK